MARKKREIYDVDIAVIEDNIRNFETNTIQYNFAVRLNELLKDKNITQEQLCRDTEISLGALSKYRNGLSEPKITNLRIIADYLDVSTDYLLGKTEIKNPDTNIRAICAYTGLSPEVIEMLKSLSAEYVKPEFLQELSTKDLELGLRKTAIDMSKILAEIYPESRISPEINEKLTTFYNLMQELTHTKARYTDEEFSSYVKWRQNIVDKENLKAINLLLSSYTGLKIINSIAHYLDEEPDTKISVEIKNDLGATTVHQARDIYTQATVAAMQEFYNELRSCDEKN